MARATKSEINSFVSSVDTRINGMRRDMDQAEAKVQALNQENFALKAKLVEVESKIAELVMAFGKLSESSVSQATFAAFVAGALAEDTAAVNE